MIPKKKSDMDLRKMSREDLIHLLETLQADIEGRKGRQKGAGLLYNLQVHQVELEMQNRALQETQQQLEEARNRYMELYDFAPIGYMTLDERGMVIDMNLTGAAMLGREKGRIIGFPFRTFVHPSGGKAFYDHLKRCRETAEKAFEVITLMKRGGEAFQAELQCVAVRDRITKKTVIRSVIIDVTARRRTEQRLQELAAAIEQSPGMVVVGTIDGRIEYVNPRFEQATGYGSSEVAGKDIAILRSPAHTAGFYGQLWSTVAAGRVWRGDISFRRKDGSLFWQLASIAPLRVFEAAVTHFIWVEVDDTERRRAEEALAREKERLSVILHGVTEGVITLDNDGRIYFMNREGERITGWAERDITGKTLSEAFTFVNERDRSRYEDPARLFLQPHAGPMLEGPVLIGKNGHERKVSGEMAPIMGKDGRVTGMVLVIRDITEQRRIMDEFLKMQKLESVVVLSGGLAAEFNKMLNLIKGNIELAGDSVPPGEARDRLREADNIVNMARDLSHQLLTFSSGGEPVLEPVYLDRILKETAGFVLAGTRIRLDTSIPDDLWLADADEEQIGQVFRNVLLNSVQSMPEGGSVSIRCENISPDESAKFSLPRGRYVRVSIKDTGAGIAKEDLPKVFDPFFTTREKGRGLGLTIAYSIVRKHRGSITVESAPGAGTEVDIYLPAP